MLRSKGFGLTGGLALFVLCLSAPAQAQFMTSYPVIIVPPPAQNLVLPKPKPVPRAAQPAPASPPDAATQNLGNCHYQGQTRVCG